MKKQLLIALLSVTILGFLSSPSAAIGIDNLSVTAFDTSSLNISYNENYIVGLHGKPDLVALPELNYLEVYNNSTERLVSLAIAGNQDYIFPAKINIELVPLTKGLEKLVGKSNGMVKVPLLSWFVDSFVEFEVGVGLGAAFHGKGALRETTTLTILQFPKNK